MKIFYPSGGYAARPKEVTNTQILHLKKLERLIVN